MTTNLDLPPEAVRLARERICGAVNDGWSIKADDVAVILDELDRLRAERDAAWQAGAEAMREAAASVASNACLVPPDGGNPTEEERLVCEEAWRRIRALPLPGQPKDGGT